jgi:hypothetical protein
MVAKAQERDAGPDGTERSGLSQMSMPMSSSTMKDFTL